MKFHLKIIQKLIFRLINEVNKERVDIKDNSEMFLDAINYENNTKDANNNNVVEYNKINKKKILKIKKKRGKYKDKKDKTEFEINIHKILEVFFK